jgi:2,5-diamino-6-(ribosylamino)-4(3H)-pyrimidinone 5'-phosphate reductase
LDYLIAKHYDFIVAGEDHVDYRVAMEELNNRYAIRTVVTNTGGVLAAALLERKLVDELRLLISPKIVGKKAVNLFRNPNQLVKLDLLKNKFLTKASCC